jgi:hypothetical protein
MRAKHLLQTAALALPIGLWAAIPAVAQNNQPNQGQQFGQQQRGQQFGQQQRGQQSRPDVLLLRDWNYNALYQNGWSVERLMDNAEVFGASGDSIGTVENVIIGANGQILGIVAQVGGFLDIGDTHVYVPWNEVRVSPGLNRVTIPVYEENVEEFEYQDPYLSLAETGRTQVVDDDLRTGPRVWKATDILNSNANLADNVGYGWISDLIFTSTGNLHAVVVNANATYGGGYYAYPYNRYGWTPGAPYNLGYDRNEIQSVPRFDYGRMNNNLVIENDAVVGARDNDWGTTGRGEFRR